MKTEKPLTINEAMSYMINEYGENYHYNTLYQWLTQGKLRGFKRGGHWRVFKKSIDTFFCPDTCNQTKQVCNGKAA